MQNGNIKPICQSSVHKICSGQVVLSLSNAIKELLENSIDAGATSIDVQLKEYGSEIIEVIDNGKGVKPCDFQSLTLKHHTSKIADFSDLPFVSTFGFRGEALSSLCALCDLEITTRDKDSEVGSLLTFDHSGALVKKTATHRQVGTTVTVKNLFYTLPVRHKEFQKHIRREYQKALHLFTAYCMISKNIRIVFSNVTGKGRKNIVLSTSCCQSFEDNVTSLFGDKQLKQLMKITQTPPTKAILEEYFISDSAVENYDTFKLEGYVSNSTHGEGRSSSDRQFFFINGRPCDMPKVVKLINEVYHSFNKHQYPFVFLNINVLRGYADVNVTPDKRKIFIPDEKVLLALIKSTLMGMYGTQPAQMSISALTFELEKAKPAFFQSQEASLKRKHESCGVKSEDSDSCSQPPKVQKSNGKLDNQFLISDCESGVLNISKETEVVDPHKITNGESEASPENNLSPKEIKPCCEDVCESNQNINFTLTVPLNEDKYFKKASPKKIGKIGSSRLKFILDSARGSPSVTENKTSNDKTESQNSNNSSKKNFNVKVIELVKNNSVGKTSLWKNKNFAFCNSEVDIDDPHSGEVEKTEDEIVNYENETDEPMLRQRKYKTVLFSFETLKNYQGAKNKDQKSCDYRKFRSRITPTENVKAEEELRKEISKESFEKMDIVGQFNLGFIIARLHDDLFIIDQHATDEKYNFEQLQKGTILETQQLLQPQNLELTAVSEATLIDNLNIFEMNGFKFKINEDGCCGQRVQLVSVPVSHNWSFGKEDVDELIFMLTDNEARMVRPSRVNQMFASRACRKSVMIGTALTNQMMKKLVTHMGEIEQPWNCPHGRPTIRHLFNLNLLKNV